MYNKLMSKNTTNGFTIVELLIVIVVIGILAAISMVAYTGIQNRSHDTAVRADLANIKKRLEMVRVDLGHYPRTVTEFPADLADLKIAKGSYDEAANNFYYIVNPAGDGYALGVRSKSKKGFILLNTELKEGVSSVTRYATAAALGVTWLGTGTSAMQGYTVGSGWRTDWPLVK